MMLRTRLHTRIDIHHRTEGGGTYIARYRPGSNYYIEGYGRSVSTALADLSEAIENPGRDSDHYIVKGDEA